MCHDVEFNCDLWGCCTCMSFNLDIHIQCTICDHIRCSSDDLDFTEKGEGIPLHHEEYNGSLETKQDDCSAILDPGNHFSSLEELEARVVAKCGIFRYPLIEGVVDATLSSKDFTIDECVTDLNGILEAFRLLQKSGFCSSHFNILVQDPNRQEVAASVQVSGESLVSLLNQAESAKSSTFIAEMDSLHELETMLIRAHGSGASGFKSIVPILAIGLASYSGSHVNRFDLTAYGSSVESFQLLGGLSFRQRPLACLADFIGGPAWVLEKAGTNPKGYMISITIDEFANLWGPVQVTENKNKSEVFGCIYTERGVITYESMTPASQAVKHGELACHWERTGSQNGDPGSSFRRMSSAQGTQDMGRGYSSSQDTTTAEAESKFSLQQKLLIGVKFCKKTNGLFYEVSCRVDTDSIRRERALALQFPGVSKTWLELDQVGIALGAGQYIVPSAQTIWKRIPGRRLKDMIMFYCKHNAAALPRMWDLRVGLEISICTGNARRITLWEALKLLHMQTSEESGKEIDSMECLHSQGSLDCVQECWNATKTWPGGPGSKKSKEKSARNQEDQIQLICQSTLEASISDLSMTGVDNDGRLQAWWPFTKGLHTFGIEIKGEDGSSNGWIPMLKESREVATFAIMSKRCLCYQAYDRLADEMISRPCSGSRRRLKLRSRTVLETAIRLHPESATELGDRKSLSLASCLRIGDIGSLEVRSEDEDQLVLFKSGLMATVSEIATCLSQAKWGNTHYELIDGEKATVKTMHVIVM